MSKNSRRQFLEQVARAGIVAPFLGATPVWAQTKPAPVTGAEDQTGVIPTKVVLTGSDLSYIGAFRIPVNAAGGDSAWSKTLAHRYVNGAIKFLSTNNSGHVFQMDDPGLGADPQSAPLATVGHDWGVVNTAAFTGSGSYSNFGLYWDPVDARLYWTYGDLYNTSYPTDPSVGYSLLNDATGQVTSVGCWRVGPSCKMAMGGVLPVPDWFANGFTNGRRLAAGFGGYFSIVTAGPASMGPSLFAFAPPNVASQPTKSLLASTNLVGYRYSAPPYGQPDRCHRDTDYVNQFDGWNPRNGVGYWDWTDYLWQGGVWIDTPNKHGVLFFPTLGNGSTYYQTSTLHAERASHAVFVYDPTALAVVAQGRKQPDEIQPSQESLIQYPGLQYPLAGWADEPAQMVTGVTYDSTTKRLYVAVRFAWSTGAIPAQGTVVYAYTVNA